MMTKGTCNLKHINAAAPARLWTVITLVEGRVRCTIHSSEYHAYKEAVARFEYAETQRASRNQQLHTLFESATIGGDYGAVRKYIEDNAVQISLLQIGEHDITGFNGRNTIAA